MCKKHGQGSQASPAPALSNEALPPSYVDRTMDLSSLELKSNPLSELNTCFLHHKSVLFLFRVGIQELLSHFGKLNTLLA